ncbi:hypothetical protein N7474_003267 [Penicillium riverlandense]|uniref:uncharacterized protein n=1 Tax=Penicillium riverlandense TaxID=1903569 RepID=UPI0025471282|nr:uncharacterized protein N7474_003267 [Penicillium riverlandense]KAJ5826129.1 hypothetical protein N7474_003267 [Penicillium riverlandense]
MRGKVTGVPRLTTTRALDSYDQVKKGVKNLFRRKKKAAKKDQESDEPSTTADSGEMTAPSATEANPAEPAPAPEAQTGTTPSFIPFSGPVLDM